MHRRGRGEPASGGRRRHGQRHQEGEVHRANDLALLAACTRRMEALLESCMGGAWLRHGR